MNYFKLDKNLVITYVIHLSLQFHLFTVFIMVENQSLSWALKYGSLFHPLLSRLNLSQDLKKQLSLHFSVKQQNLGNFFFYRKVQVGDDSRTGIF